MQIHVERLPGEPGDRHVFESVLIVGDEKDTRIGTPIVKGAEVSAKILDQGKAPKVLVFKMKRRKKYRVKRGHRQMTTFVEITGIKG